MTLSYDLPAEAQLHLIPCEVAILRTATATGADTSSLAEHTLTKRPETLAAAMETSVGAADRNLTELTVLEPETAGELELSRIAMALAYPDS